MKLFYKEKIGNKRILHICGIKISYNNYKSLSNNYKYLYENTLSQLNYLKKHSDITKLKPATGELRELQLKILNLTSEITTIINNNNLEYFLIGGSLLGAVRHNGFIPWDDDFDIGMMRSDYEKFSQYCSENMVTIDTSSLNIKNTEKYTKDRYMLYDEYLRKYPNKYIFFRCNEHIVILKGTSFFNCSTLDIFSFDYIDEKISQDEYIFEYKKILKKQYEIGDLNKILLYLKDCIKNSQIIKKKSNLIAGSFDSSTLVAYNYYCDTKDIFPLKKIKFEQTEFFVPNNSHKILNDQYKNYMEFPNDIGTSHHQDYKFKYFKPLVIQDKTSQIEFYLIDAFEIYHFLPIYNELLKQGIKTRIVAEPCKINTSGKWFDYNTAIRILEENNIDYCTKCNPNAKIAITTQTVDILSKYKNKKACYSYGVGLNKNNFAITKDTIEGFDIRFVHGQYQKDIQKMFMNENKIYIMGWPKHEQYFVSPRNKIEILEKIKIDTDKKIIVYFPTWDEDSSIQMFADKIKKLQNKYYIVTKAHHCTFRLDDKIEDLNKLYEISDIVLDGNSSFEDAVLIADYALIDAKSGASTEIPYLNPNLKALFLSPRKDLNLYYDNSVLSKVKIINSYDAFDNAINNLQNTSESSIDIDYFCKNIEKPSEKVVEILKQYIK